MERLSLKTPHAVLCKKMDCDHEDFFFFFEKWWLGACSTIHHLWIWAAGTSSFFFLFCRLWMEIAFNKTVASVRGNSSLVFLPFGGKKKTFGATKWALETQSFKILQRLQSRKWLITHGAQRTCRQMHLSEGSTQCGIFFYINFLLEYVQWSSCLFLPWITFS